LLIKGENMKKFRFVLVSDLKAYMEDRAFTQTHLLYLGLLSLVMVIGWPGGAFLSFQQPQVFLALSYAQIVILTYSGGRLAVRSSLRGEVSLEDWLKYTPISPIEVAMGRLWGLFLYVLIMFSSSLPLVILCYSIGGIFLRSALTVYCLLLLLVIAFINFGLLLSLVSHEFSVLILNLISFFLVLGLFLTRTDQRDLFYLNPRFLLFILILSTFAFFIFVRRLTKMRVNLS